MNKLKKNNVLNFPRKISEIEREIEAIIFAAAEPLSIETIESKISKIFLGKFTTLFFFNLFINFLL